MKTKYRYIQFKPWGTSWVCMTNKTPATKLGIVEYWAPWREWEFCPNPHTGYTVECLRDIAHFISQLPKP